MAAREHVGHVATINRYPVKSLQGEQLAEAWADERGLLGDRATWRRLCTLDICVSAPRTR